MKLGLSILCENPSRKTGLTTTYHQFVARSLELYPDLQWVVFVGPNQEWQVTDPRVEVIRRFPANDDLKRRLLADHLKVPAEARAKGVDLLITTGFVPLRKCLPIAMHVFSLQHLDEKNKMGLARNWYRNWVTRGWPKADMVITNSRVTSSQVLEMFPQLRSRLVEAYEGLRHDQFNTSVGPDEVRQLKSQLGLDPGYFLWASNFYPYKQADKLISAYARLKPELRQSHPLVMVGGEWGGYRAAAREQAHALGLAKDVQFFGWVDDQLLAPLYHHAVAHVLPSREETFGRTVIESMACGTPVLVNDIPIMHEVTAGKGLIVDFDDAAGAAEALMNIASDNKLRADLRAGGLARARDFTFEKFTSERINAIQRLVSALRAGHDFKA